MNLSHLILNKHYQLPQQFVNNISDNLPSFHSLKLKKNYSNISIYTILSFFFSKFHQNTYQKLY